jgi:holliday junction DNA helicase RuvA
VNNVIIHLFPQYEGKGNKMIGKLKGLVDSHGTDWVLIDVNGVGYVVYCSSRTLGSLPPAGEACVLAIETHVREDMIRLFGFASDLEREWFRLLNTVQGVGTKVALSILSTLKASDLASAISLKDKAMISKANGVGAKVAERICIELKDKAPLFTDIDPKMMKLAGDTDSPIRIDGALGDAVSALVNLGYGQAQAASAVYAASAKGGEGMSVQTLIRMGLKELNG